MGGIPLTELYSVVPQISSGTVLSEMKCFNIQTHLRFLLFRFPILVLLFLLLNPPTTVHSANILYISGSLSAGNHIYNRVIATSLANRGYNVTFLTPERDQISDAQKSNGLLHFIHMDGVYEEVFTKYGFARDNHLQNRQTVFRRIKESYRVANGISGAMSRTAAARRLLTDDNDYPSHHFDCIIHDGNGAQSLLGFWAHFNRPPLISVNPGNLPGHLQSAANIPSYPGVMLHPMADYATELVLANRVYNILYFLYDTIYSTFPFMRSENMLAKRLFGDHLESLEEIQSNTKLFLVNTNPVIDSVPPLPPNVVPVGAVQLDRAGGLAEDHPIRMFLDASKNGVVVFSLGAGLFTPALTREEDEVFLDVFKSLYQYDFLWKYDKREKLECPRNVLMMDWLQSQHLILQHPKVRLFITNGGPLSIQEAVYAAVPLIGIPMRLDQRQRLTRMQREGAAQLLPLRRLRNDTLTAVVMKALDQHR